MATGYVSEQRRQHLVLMNVLSNVKQVENVCWHSSEDVCVKLQTVVQMCGSEVQWLVC